MKFTACFLLLALVVAAVYASDCPTICTSEYRPVCGKNDAGELKTFATLCVMKSTNCLRKTSFEFERDGAC